MKTLKQILKENNLNISLNKYGTDKGDFKSYIDLFYDSFFFKYRNKKINLLEIGFRNGASLLLWSRYFKKGKILGLDNGSDILIKEKSFIEEWLNQPNIQTKICDAYSKDVAKAINIKFDIIIDDGPHNIKSQIKAISMYFPKLKQNGVLIIEDLLKGYLTSLVLIFFTPLNSEIKVLNFRWHKPGRDNMLYIIKKKKYDYFIFFKRLILLFKVFFKIPNELLYKSNSLKLN